MCNEHELKCENKPVAAARKSKTQTGVTIQEEETRRVTSQEEETLTLAPEES